MRPKSFQPKEFIAIAELLAQNKPCPENMNRSIINRCYYAVFGHIKQNIAFYDNSPSVHNNLIASLIASPHIEEKKIGKKLQDLFKKRKDADYAYNNSSTIFKNMNVGFQIVIAKSIIEDFDAFKI